MARARWISAFFAAVALLMGGGTATAQTVSSCPIPSGARWLCHEVVLSAPSDDVWALWTTTDGLSSWVAPIAAIDPVAGGVFETSYDASARLGDAGNIRNRVIAILPEHMIVLQIDQAPPGFPHAEAARELITQIDVERLSANETRVRVLMSGFGEGAAFDALLAFFERGNAFTLETLARRISDGPTDWTRAQ